ncbi:uncharacterized protein LOC128242507 [Mya arenaria]|uniref:uncharacterized protein LOC128242507 n=1 Tax=Mya arenaria TaxID=6604 RepID=UPI0022E30E5E|nr:uncharacterized protein LOC128242507 [Mya arenaria]
MGIETNFRSANVITVVATGSLIVTTVIFLVGFSTANWVTAVIGEHRFNVGLWKSCYCNYGFTPKFCICGNIGEENGGVQLEDWYKASRACAVIALIFLFAAMGVSVASIFLSQSPYLRMACIALVPSAGVMIAISVIVYAVKLFDNPSNDVFALAYSFHLCAVTASICMFILTPLYGIGHVRTKPGVSNMAQPGMVIHAPGQAYVVNNQTTFPMTSHPHQSHTNPAIVPEEKIKHITDATIDI